MALKFNSIAGFSDLHNGVLAAEQPARASNLNRIISNAEFAMVRMEFFQARYIDGDTVILPTSTVDQYAYGRDELLYFWSDANTQNAQNNWITGPDCLWFLAHKVDQVTGLVSSEEWYRKSSVHNPGGAKSNDGILLVTTVAQRQLKNIVLSVEPQYQGDLSLSIGLDKAWTEKLAQQFNDAAKFAALRTEFFYCGEYTNGQTVPLSTLVSPADGHLYRYSDCIFIPSWRWTTTGASYKQPDNYLGQLQRLAMSVGPTGLVATAVIYKGDETSVYTTTHGRVSVFALASRPLVIGPPRPDPGVIPGDPGAH